MMSAKYLPMRTLETPNEKTIIIILLLVALTFEWHLKIQESHT